MIDKITLIDGRELECYPPALPRETVLTDDIALDTTSRYLQVGKKARFNTGKELAERRKQDEIFDRLFYEHAHLFLANADKILSDSRLFLAPVHVVNGLAYTGTSGLQAPTLGIYIEWWLHHKDASIDSKGRPIWFISGSPLSGCHACSSVDRKGKMHRAQLNGGFSSVWRSFMKINRRYTEAKGKYFAYELTEVMEILEGQTDEQRLFRLHIRLAKGRYDTCISRLRKSLEMARQQSDGYRAKIQQLIFDRHREAAEAYYRKCVALRAIAEESREEFRQRRIEARRALRSGSIDNKTYQTSLAPLRKKTEETEFQAHIYERDGLSTLFGEDCHYFTFDIIETLLRQNQPEDNR